MTRKLINGRWSDEAAIQTMEQEALDIGTDFNPDPTEADNAWQNEKGQWTYVRTPFDLYTLKQQSRRLAYSLLRQYRLYPTTMREDRINRIVDRAFLRDHRRFLAWQRTFHA